MKKQELVGLVRQLDLHIAQLTSELSLTDDVVEALSRRVAALEYALQAGVRSSVVYAVRVRAKVPDA